MQRARGFTLLELLICLLLVAVLGALSLPGFSEMLAHRRSDAVMRKLADAIALARTTAVASGELVTLCRWGSGTECGGNWQDGILLFTDHNGDRRINQDDAVRHYFSFPDADGALRWRAFQNRQYLQITNQGFTRFQNGNFTYCPASRKAELARQLIINRTARARFAIDSDGDGIKEDSSGKPLTCD